MRRYLRATEHGCVSLRRGDRAGQEFKSGVGPGRRPRLWMRPTEVSRILVFDDPRRVRTAFGYLLRDSRTLAAQVRPPLRDLEAAVGTRPCANDFESR